MSPRRWGCRASAPIVGWRVSMRRAMLVCMTAVRDLIRCRRALAMMSKQPCSPPESPIAARRTIHAGRNRQVRRMCAAVGHPVRRLVRTRIGPLRDQHLAPGSGANCRG